METKQEARAANRRWYERNKEQEQERGRKKRADNAEYYRLQALKWNREHPERCKENNRNWRQANPEKVRQKTQKRNALKKGNAVGIVDYEVILERDGLICHICTEAVEPQDVHFDHVIPLSKGGPHSMENIKVAHARCNTRKGDKLNFNLAKEVV